MKNVTITLPEVVLEGLRERARREQKSLNQWLRELLSKEVVDDDSWATAFLKLTNELKSNADGRVWNREEAYGERIR